MFTTSESSAGSPATALVESIVSEDYWIRQDVATGRFLRDFDLDLDSLYGVDTERWRVLRRGRNWVEIEGPWEPEEEDEFPKTARLRFVKTEDTWKLENLRILKEPFGDW